jgi:signal transduction histidine kinase
LHAVPPPPGPAEIPADAFLQLRRSRDQLDGILRALTDGVLVRDFTGTLVYANDPAARLFARPDAAALLVDPPSPDEVRLADEDGHPLLEPPDRTAFRERPPDRVVMICCAGEARFCLWRAMPIADDGGRVISVVSVLRDVTEERKARLDRDQLIALLRSDRARLAAARREAEESADRMEVLQRLAAELSGALTTDQVGEAIVERGRTALGAARAGLWRIRKGTATLACGHGFDESWRSAPLSAELPFTQAARTLEPVWIHGGEPPMRSLVALPLVAGGRAVAALVFGFDGQRAFGQREREYMLLIAHHAALALERARLQEADALARRKAEEASRAKDEFLAILGHELRNPLAPIVTALELMRQRTAGGERERSVIERQVQHLVRLVDDLLDVSRITRGKLELKKERLDLADAIARGIELASPLVEQRRQHLEVSVERGVFVDGDPARLAQVVSNLLVNAAKYTDEGGHLRVAARAEDGAAVCSVRDDGIGIPAELLPRVFDAFVQGKQPADRAGGGVGLGLAIVRSLVQLHRGEVFARSAGERQGSEFVFRLPLARPPQVAAPPSRPQPVAPVRRRVMIVDDNTDAAELLCEALRSAGCEVAVAHDGPSALRLAESFAPEVAVLDIGLPVMDGYELASRLRDLPTPPLRLFALTGYGQPGDRARAAAAGFERHLVKPVDIAELRALIRS